MKYFFAILLLLNFTACSTMRLGFEADVDVSGTAKKFQYENSYEVGGGIPTFCGLTAIFLGGACWYYLVMPTVPDQQKVQDDAEVELKKKMDGKPYSLRNTHTGLRGWDKGAVLSHLE